MCISCIRERYPGRNDLSPGWDSGWNTIFVGKGKWGCSLLEENKLFLGKMNGPLEEEMGDMTVGGTVCLMSTSSLLSCDQSVLVEETSREKIYDSWVPFRGSVLGQGRDIQRKLLPALAVLQVITAQNNQYTKVADLGTAYSATLQDHGKDVSRNRSWRWGISLQMYILFSVLEFKQCLP